jgi:hypothetical protein
LSAIQPQKKTWMKIHLLINLLPRSTSGKNFSGALATIDYKNVANENEQITANDTPLSVDFQLVLIKAMIAAAKADGHINNEEQQRIFNAVDTIQLSYEVKGLVFEYRQNKRPIRGHSTLSVRSTAMPHSC